MAAALQQTVIGVIIGMALALVAGRALRSILFGVGPNDPAALTLSAAVMLAVAAVAAWLPRGARCGSIPPNNSEPTSQDPHLWTPQRSCVSFMCGGQRTR